MNNLALCKGGRVYSPNCRARKDGNGAAQIGRDTTGKSIDDWSFENVFIRRMPCSDAKIADSQISDFFEM